MSDIVEQYLDKVMRHAALAGADDRRVRAELRDHLHDLLGDRSETFLNSQEALAMVMKEFGDPHVLGHAIAGAKGRFRTFVKKRGKLAVAASVLLVLAVFGIRAEVAEAFFVPGGSVAPQLPAGSRCLVYKLSSDFKPGDIIVYSPTERPQSRFLAVVRGIDAGTNGLIVERNQVKPYVVARSAVVGRVVANTR